MSQENVELVRRLYDAAARRDTTTLLALYHPDVEWDATLIPVGGLIGQGFYRGHEGLRSFFRDWYAAWEHVEEHPRELIDAGERVISVATQRGRGRASGAAVERTTAGVWTIREGKVVRVVFFPTRAEALEAAEHLE